jgi:hypothetical protein
MGGVTSRHAVRGAEPHGHGDRAAARPLYFTEPGHGKYDPRSTCCAAVPI